AKPLAQDLMLPDSHFAKMTADPTGTVLWQNMPYYQINRQGLIQVGYTANAAAQTQQLSRRFGINPEDNLSDALLPYLQFELSATFFAPSISFLELSARG
ncbi:MAG TPA: peroxidase, partial [Rheinheimera sp.]|nr:peroxidase [Rheinheimera sp.]